MQPTAPRNRLILLGFALGLFGVFAASPVRAEITSDRPLVVVSEAATSAGVVAILGSPEGSDSVLTGVAIDVPDDFGVALEDSDEMLRGEIQPQQACGLDHAVAGPRVTAQIAQSSRAIVSPPLLV